MRSLHVAFHDKYPAIHPTTCRGWGNSCYNMLKREWIKHCLSSNKRSDTGSPSGARWAGSGPPIHQSLKNELGFCLPEQLLLRIQPHGKPFSYRYVGIFFKIIFKRILVLHISQRKHTNAEPYCSLSSGCSVKHWSYRYIHLFLHLARRHCCIRDLFLQSCSQLYENRIMWYTLYVKFAIMCTNFANC